MSYNKTKLYFLKLPADFFDRDEIKWLEKQPDGYEMLLLYQKLIFKTINKDGKLMMTIGKKQLPYSIEQMAQETGHSESLVKKAINIFLDLEMLTKEENDIYLIDDAIIMTINQTAGAMKRQNERQNVRHKARQKSQVNKDICQRDIEIDKDKEIDIELEDREKKKEKEGDKERSSYSPNDYFEEALNEV